MPLKSLALLLFVACCATSIIGCGKSANKVIVAPSTAESEQELEDYDKLQSEDGYAE